MPGNDALHDGQANAGAREFFLGMQALEGSEQFFGIGHVKAGAVVANIVDALLLPPGDADFDAGMFDMTGKFPRIAE